MTRAWSCRVLSGNWLTIRLLFPNALRLHSALPKRCFCGNSGQLLCSSACRRHPSSVGLRFWLHSRRRMAWEANHSVSIHYNTGYSNFWQCPLAHRATSFNAKNPGETQGMRSVLSRIFSAVLCHVLPSRSSLEKAVHSRRSSKNKTLEGLARHLVCLSPYPQVLFKIALSFHHS